MRILLFVLIWCCLIFSACGDEVDCTSEFAFQEAIQDEQDAVDNAATIFANDPSDDNCRDLKNLANDFLDAVRDFEDCAREQGDLQEFQDSLSEAEDAIATLDC